VQRTLLHFDSNFLNLTTTTDNQTAIDIKIEIMVPIKSLSPNTNTK